VARFTFLFLSGNGNENNHRQEFFVATEPDETARIAVTLVRGPLVWRWRKDNGQTDLFLGGKWVGAVRKSYRRGFWAINNRAFGPRMSLDEEYETEAEARRVVEENVIKVLAN